MGLRTITFTIESPLPPATARDRAADLLTAERVRYTVTPWGVQSTKTPYGLNFQRVWYSRRNWIGVNPFAHVSAVDLSFAAGHASTTVVTVRLDRLRAFFLASPYSYGYLLAPMMPWPVALFAVFVCTVLIWFLVWHVPERLLRGEIERELDARAV